MRLAYDSTAFRSLPRRERLAGYPLVVSGQPVVGKRLPGRREGISAKVELMGRRSNPPSTRGARTGAWELEPERCVAHHSSSSQSMPPTEPFATASLTGRSSTRSWTSIGDACGTPEQATGRFGPGGWSSSTTGRIKVMGRRHWSSRYGSRSSLSSMDGHYDRSADIAWVRFDGWEKDRVRVERADKGLIERDRTSGRVLGLEFWKASERLPRELLDALPSPPTRNIAVERQHA
jgi:uncharacterized protein YuzE